MMKLRQPSLGLLLALGACLAAPALAQNPPAAAGSAPEAATVPGSDGREGTFKTVQGEVTVVRGATRSAAIAGAGVQASDRIVTGAKSAASLTLRDGTRLSIGPDSTMDLSTYEFDATTEEGNVLVALLRGSLRMATGLIARLKPEHVKVTTPTSVIGVRGTDFIVEANR